jgi:hypothetical protein
MKTPEEQTLQHLLGHTRRRFYENHPPKRWHEDRLALIKALTWPARWLTRHGVSISQARYRQLLEERLTAIAAHGDPKRRRAYFPAYLIKCLQDHFAHHGETLYDELKHIRNALYGLEIHINIRERSREENAQIEALARTHSLLAVKAQGKRKTRAKPSDQLELF